MKGSFFDQNDFISLKTEISIRNISTDSIISSSSWSSRGTVMATSRAEKTTIQIQEMGNELLTLSVPRYTGASGHILELHLKLTQGKRILQEFDIQCKIISNEKTSNETDQIQLQVNVHDAQKWEKYLNIISNRQSEISNFLAKVKGAA